MAVLYYLIGILVIIITYYILKLLRKYQYWTNHGIKGPKPFPLIGTMLPVILRKISLGNFYMGVYKQFNETERFAGTYTLIRKELVVLKPEDAEAILIRDFSHFMNRGQFPVNEKLNPHGANLFALCGSRWRALRMKVSPAFTTGKIKGMIDQMTKCWDNIDNYIEKNISEPFDMKKLISMFATDVIASVAFGIDPSKLGEPDTEFRRNAMEFFNFSVFRLLVFFMNIVAPVVTTTFRLPAIPKKVTDYFADITTKTMEYRRANNIERNDFLQMMMQLQEKGSVDVTNWDADDNYLGLSADKTNIESIDITESIVVSQAIIFFTAGFESSSNTITFGLVDMLQKPAIVEKARREIEAAVAKHNGFTYDALKDMVYLDQCIKETLRLHPALLVTFRTCTKPYQFPGSNLKIDTGTGIIIPIFGYHMDPKYWDNPTEYRPERFDPGQTRVPMTYMPFGDGPRSCIAMRFAQIEVKVGLAKLLLNYDIEIHPDTEIPIRSNIASFLNSPVSPVIFNIKKRDVTLKS